MRYRIKCYLFPLLAAILGVLAMSPAPVHASTTKKISSVSLHVKNRLEIGQSVNSEDVVDSDSPDDGEIGVWETSDHYEITSLKITNGTSKDLTVASAVKVRVVLEITDDDYIFKSGFSKGSVNVSGPASCSGVSRKSDQLTVTLTMDGVRGQYDAPEDAYWRENHIGHARWVAPDAGSGHYEVMLKRGGQIVKRVTDTTDTSYNFYPYMTKAGTYTFRVRTIPSTDKQKKYGKNSDWTESEDWYLDADDVSDGSGAIWDDTTGGGTSGQTALLPAGEAGWYIENGFWYYKYPDGSIKKDGWELVSGKYYFFNDTGRMQTGWIQRPSGWYFLDPTGAMVTGWQDVSGTWYYFNENPNDLNYGVMVTNAYVDAGGHRAYLDGKGHRQSGWVQVGDHWSYFYPETGDMARSCWIDTFYVDENGAWRR